MAIDKSEAVAKLITVLSILPRETGLIGAFLFLKEKLREEQNDPTGLMERTTALVDVVCAIYNLEEFEDALG